MLIHGGVRKEDEEEKKTYFKMVNWVEHKAI